MGIHDRHYSRPQGSFSPVNKRPPGSLSVNTWIIVSCVAVFVIDPFLNGIFQEWLHLSTDHAIRDIQYWRFVGFQFLHANFAHLVFNMIGLYFFGPLVERYLGGKRYLAFYLLCGILGAVLYLVLNLGGVIFQTNLFGLLFNDTSSKLIGASAGVFGVLLAGAYLAPKIKVLLFLIIPMRLSTLAYALVAFALFTVIFGDADSNRGGEAAHLGGAAAGWYFIRNPHHLNGFFDFLGKADPTSKHFALKQKKNSQMEVDHILDKIHRDGLQSLTSKEKKILHDASKNKRGDE